MTNKRATAALLLLALVACQDETQPENTAGGGAGEQDAPAAIGDFRQGGIVFWVDTSDATTGLVVAMDDLLATAQWGCHGTAVGGANSTSLFGGAANTSDIVSSCNFVGIAAELCDKSVDRGFSDWWLPNSAELEQIIANLETVEGAALDHGGRAFYDKYWTSNQPTGVVGETLAVAVDIRANHYSQESKNDTYAVRAIRQF